MIKLNQLLKEETFTATNKATGKTSVFKSKESRDAAIKAGTHNPIKDTEQPSAPKAAGSDMFGGDYAKDRGAVSAKGGPGSGRRPAEAPKQGGDEILVVYKNKARINKTKSFTDADAARKFADANGGTLAKMVGGKLLAMPKTTVLGKGEEPNQVQSKPKSKWDDAPADSTKPWQAGSSTTSKEKSQYDEPTYWKDEKKYYDEEDDVEKTSDRLDKVEKALSDDLKLEDNGFETTRESGGGAGGWEGPMTIIDKNSDYDNGYNCLSIGSGENDGKFSIGFYNQDGEPVFDDEDYGSLTGEKVLSAKQAYKIGKVLMGMPEVQKFIKGEMTSDEFEAVHSKIKSKLNKSANEGIIKLTKIMEAGPCWKGYKQVGMKDKNGKEVPNCVPEGVIKEASGRVPMYNAYHALFMKVRSLEDAQKEMFKKYSAEKELNKKNNLLQQLKKGTDDLKAWRGRMQKAENDYVLNLDRDAELEMN